MILADEEALHRFIYHNLRRSKRSFKRNRSYNRICKRNNIISLKKYII